MSSLTNYRSAYARCLSPCRHTARGLHRTSQPHTRWRSQPPLQRCPWVDNAVGAGPKRTSARSISVKLPHVPAAPGAWKSNLQEWSTRSKSVLDMSMLRVVASLNLDLPKITATLRAKPKVEADTSSHNPTQTQLPVVYNPVVVDVDIHKKTRERLKAKLEQQHGPREQYNLEDAVQAMSGNTTSSHVYNSTGTVNMSQNVARKEDTKVQKPDHGLPSPTPTKSSPKVKTKSGSGSAAAASAGLNAIKNMIPTSIIPTNIIPTNIISKTLPIMAKKTSPASVKTTDKKEEGMVKRQLVSKASIDRRTRALVLSFKTASSSDSKLARLGELCKHLVLYPESTNVAVKEKVVPSLLRLQQSTDVQQSTDIQQNTDVQQSTDALLREVACEVLALVGYTHPVRGRGINILTLDGGGTRGLISIEMLRKIEEACGKPIQDLFDYICGVSTGSLIAMMTGVYRHPLDKCVGLYEEFSTEMFRRSKIMGAGKLFTSHAYYDAALFEDILKEQIGLRGMLETNRDPKCPKLGTPSSLRNVTKTEIFMFRNYNLAPGVQSHYLGSCKYKVWEAIRASSAAPGYYEEKKLDDVYHVDGGVLTNNPTAIAIHESKLLWPTTPIQCVVSVGTGRYESTAQQATSSTPYNSLKSKIFQIVQSATDTEAVHTILQDLLPPQTYFRFNPYMSEDFQLDEVNPDKWEKMKHDTQMYSRKNDYKLKKAAQVLLQPKQTHQKAYDWLKLKKDMIG